MPWLHVLAPMAVVPREEAGVCFSVSRHGDLFVAGALSLGSLKLSRWQCGSRASPGRTLGSLSSRGVAEAGARLVLWQQAQKCETWEETRPEAAALPCRHGAGAALSAPGCDKRRRGKATGLQRAAAAATPRKLHRYRRRAAPRGPASASINHGEEGLSLLLPLLSLLQHGWGRGGTGTAARGHTWARRPPPWLLPRVRQGQELLGCSRVRSRLQGKLLSWLSL